PIAEIVRRSVRRSVDDDDVGPGAYAVAAILLFVSSGAKASSLPVVAAAIVFTFVVLLVAYRRIPWGVVGVGAITAAAQFFAIAAIFHFQTYGVAFGPLQGLSPFWTGMGGGWVVLGVWVAFLLNMQLRTAGIVPLLWLRRLRLEPEQWFLVGGATAGPAIYLVFSQPSSGNQYFTRAGFTFGVIASAWGFAELYERSRLGRGATQALIAVAAAFSVVLVWAQLAYAQPQTTVGDAF